MKRTQTQRTSRRFILITLLFVALPMMVYAQPDIATPESSETSSLDSSIVQWLMFFLRLMNESRTEESPGMAGADETSDTLNVAAGTWIPRYLLDDPRFQNCGNPLVGSSRFTPPPFEISTTLEDFLRDVVVANFQAAGGDIVWELTTPAANTYIVTGISSIGNFVYEYYVRDSNTIETLSTTPGEDDCQIVVPGIAERQTDP